jgi:hypothetical protein
MATQVQLLKVNVKIHAKGHLGLHLLPAVFFTTANGKKYRNHQGYKVKAITDTSPFYKILCKGDIITHWNSIPLMNLGSHGLRHVIKESQNAGNFILNIKRIFGAAVEQNVPFERTTHAKSTNCTETISAENRECKNSRKRSVLENSNKLDEAKNCKGKKFDVKPQSVDAGGTRDFKKQIQRDKISTPIGTDANMPECSNPTTMTMKACPSQTLAGCEEKKLHVKPLKTLAQSKSTEETKNRNLRMDETSHLKANKNEAKSRAQIEVHHRVKSIKACKLTTDEKSGEQGAQKYNLDLQSNLSHDKMAKQDSQMSTLAELEQIVVHIPTTLSIGIMIEKHLSGEFAVTHILLTSPLYGKIHCGDRLVYFNGFHLSNLSPAALKKLVTERKEGVLRIHIRRKSAQEKGLNSARENEARAEKEKRRSGADIEVKLRASEDLSEGKAKEAEAKRLARAKPSEDNVQKRREVAFGSKHNTDHEAAMKVLEDKAKESEAKRLAKAKPIEENARKRPDVAFGAKHNTDHEAAMKVLEDKAKETEAERLAKAKPIEDNARKRPDVAFEAKHSTDHEAAMKVLEDKAKESEAERLVKAKTIEDNAREGLEVAFGAKHSTDHEAAMKVLEDKAKESEAKRLAKSKPIEDNARKRLEVAFEAKHSTDHEAKLRASGESLIDQTKVFAKDQTSLTASEDYREENDKSKRCVEDQDIKQNTNEKEDDDTKKRRNFDVVEVEKLSGRSQSMPKKFVRVLKQSQIVNIDIHALPICHAFVPNDQISEKLADEKNKKLQVSIKFRYRRGKRQRRCAYKSAKKAKFPL